jgi:hypothetical protein
MRCNLLQLAATGCKWESGVVDGGEQGLDVTMGGLVYGGNQGRAADPEL